MKKAFTLIEFLVLVAIVAILAAILFPFLCSRGATGTTASEFDGCMEPKVVSTTPVTDPITGRTEVEYIYRCDDGRQIASRTKPQELNLR